MIGFFEKMTTSKKTLNGIRFACLVFVFCFLFSCQTIRVKEIDPFSAIGEGADVYVFLPTAGNENFLEMILGTRVDRQDIKMAIDRTKSIYAGFFNSASSPRKAEEALVCAVGRYPANMAGSIFKEKNGWTRYTAKNDVNYYSGGMSAVSIPNDSNAFLALSDKPETSMQFFLDNASSEKIVPLSQKYNLFVENPVAGTVAIFIKNPNFFIAKILGVDLQLPVKASEIYLTKNTGESTYNYDFSVETGNNMTAFALSLLLKKTINADVKTSGATLFIENGKLTEEDLATLLKQTF